uniref:Uncharacterized protein n=1 Tax=Coptotermes formosanus TaxID=36987 RepID=R4UP43_COPFO|nr:hypothetical protein [Coptotermes formosanus]
MEAMKKHYEMKKVEFQKSMEEKEKVEQGCLKLRTDVNSLRKEIELENEEKLKLKLKISELEGYVEKLKEKIEQDEETIKYLEDQLNNPFQTRTAFLDVYDDPLKSVTFEVDDVLEAKSHNFSYIDPLPTTEETFLFQQPSSHFV